MKCMPAHQVLSSPVQNRKHLPSYSGALCYRHNSQSLQRRLWSVLTKYRIKVYISGYRVGCICLRPEEKCLLVFHSHTFCLVKQICGLLQISLDTYLIKQSESFHWERAGSQVKISLISVFTYSAGISSVSRFVPMPLTFTYPSEQRKDPPPSRVLGNICKGQLAKTPPGIKLWIQMFFNSEASRKGFCEGGNFFFSIPPRPNNLCFFIHSCSDRLAGLLPLTLFWATRKAFPQACMSAGG